MRKLTRAARTNLTDKVPVEELTNRARSVTRDAPKALDPRTTSRKRLSAFATTLILLGAILWAVPFLPVLLALLVVFGIPYLASKRKSLGSTSSSKQWGRK